MTYPSDESTASLYCLERGCDQKYTVKDAEHHNMILSCNSYVSNDSNPKFGGGEFWTGVAQVGATTSTTTYSRCSAYKRTFQETAGPTPTCMCKLRALLGKNNKLWKNLGSHFTAAYTMETLTLRPRRLRHLARVRGDCPRILVYLLVTGTMSWRCHA